MDEIDKDIDAEYEKQEEIIQLPKEGDAGSNPTKKRSKTPSVLKNQRFEPPRMDALKKATVYRLSITNKSRKLPDKVFLKRKKKGQAATSDSEDEGSHLSLNFLQHKADDGPGYFDPTEDYDFDSEDMHGFSDHIENTETPSQALYRNVCKNLHVTPSSLVYRCLNEHVMKLRHHLLGEKGTKAVATALVGNITVKTLELHDNDVRPQGACYISDMLRENLSITELTLSDNNIGSSGLRSLMTNLETNENIVKLNLSGNNLDENDAVSIAKMLEENTIIKDLNLSCNKFREKGGEIIGHAIGCNDAIEVVDLSWNHLRRKGATAVADMLLRNISIIDLDVSWNGFYLEGSRAFMRSLRSNKVLEKLNLTCNRIDFECVQELVKGLNGNSTLTSLNLSNNPLTSTGAFLLVKTIHDNTNIKINMLDIHTQMVDVDFLQMYEIIRERQQIHIKHGVIRDQHIPGGSGDEEFSHEDPMIVLMELMKIMQFRLIDLFSALDKDHNKLLSAEELKNGLMSVHVPMTEKAVERLVKKLDTDGDGQVDFGELIEGQKLHQAKRRRLKELEFDLPFQETEIGRIHMKLKHLMSSGQAEAVKKAEALREQRAKDRMLALGLLD